MLDRSPALRGQCPDAPPLPEGELRIAHAFKRGIMGEGPRVPKGRLNHAYFNGNRGGPETSEGLGRPFGTHATANRNPAVNCRASIKSPSGVAVLSQPAPVGARRAAALPTGYLHRCLRHQR